MKCSTWRISVFAVLASCVFLTVAALAAEPRITATSRAKPSHELTPAERRATSLAAGRILRHAYLARQAVTEEDKEKVDQEVDQALKLVQILESVEPKYVVTAEIDAGKLSYKADEVVTPPLIPIYDEVGEVELIGPLEAAKKEKRGGDDSTEAVEEVDVEHTSLALNLAFAKAGLRQAKKALGEGDWKSTDRALADVQRSAVFEVDTLDAPLATARQNLYLAHSRVQNGDLEGTRAALDEASQALDNYAKIGGTGRSAEVEKLRSEIDGLSNEIASGKQGDSTSEKIDERILSWWDRVVQWWEA
jgi:hypothetical protein